MTAASHATMLALVIRGNRAACSTLDLRGRRARSTSSTQLPGHPHSSGKFRPGWIWILLPEEPTARPLGRRQTDRDVSFSLPQPVALMTILGILSKPCALIR